MIDAEQPESRAHVHPDDQLALRQGARSMDGPGRFDDVVAVSVAVLFGVLAFFLVGMQVFAIGVWILPWLAPALLGLGMLGGVLMVVRGRRSARGFGAGMVGGWVLLALWTSGMSVGLYSVQDGFSWW